MQDKLDPEVGLPRYQEITNDLLSKIGTGDLKVGDQFPTEIELARQYAVSRHTIRETMRCLQDLGMITRRKGAGTYLTSGAPKRDYAYSINTLEQLTQYAHDTKIEVLAVDSILADTATALRLQCDPGANWIRISLLRVRPGESGPIGFSELFIHPDYADVVEDIGTRSQAVYALLEEKYGVQITRVMQEIEAGVASVNIASRLSVEVGKPVLEITRRYYTSDEQLIEASVNIHPAGRFRYETQLSREG